MAAPFFFGTGVSIFNPDISPAGIPLKLFIDINWNTDVAERMISASYRLRRFDVLTRTLARKAVHSMRRNIAESRSPGGKKYDPLKNPRAPGHGQDPRPLFDSGKLYGDLQYKMLSDHSAQIGHTTATWYGKLHNRGVSHPWVITAKNRRVLRFWTADGWRFARSVTHPGLVQREFVGLRTEDVPDVKEVLGAWATKVFDPAAALGLASGEMEASA